MDQDPLDVTSDEDEIDNDNPGQKHSYSVFGSQNFEAIEEKSDNEDEEFTEQPEDNSEHTIWNQNETLALINIFSLHKDRFGQFKQKKQRWTLVSEELLKIGIDKTPKKCEVKWRNLIRSYKAYKSSNKERGKFEFFNELDYIVSNDPQFKKILRRTVKPANRNSITIKKDSISRSKTPALLEHNSRKRKCYCSISEKQKRHEDRIALLRKKVEIEERKVQAFEDYLKYLRNSNSE